MKIINKIASSIVIASIMTYYAGPVIAYVNEETIYSNLDSNGNVYKSTVTTITEDEKETKTEQNETEKTLPIETKITYYLDGKEMDSSKIAGKSGRVTIKLEFENKEKHEDLYTPFVVVSGLMINNKENTNIDIVNGKLLTNGNSCIAVGLSFPGMAESLGIDEDTIKIPNFVEISMDTEKFEMGNIFIYASPKLLGELDISMDDFDEIFDKINALEIASKALEDGAVSLSDGIEILDAGVIELSSGAKNLNDGVTTLKSGANDLANGVNTLNSEYGTLDSGITDLKDGVSTLASGASALDSGAGALVDGISQVSNGVTGLATGISAVSTGVNGVVSGIESVDSGVNSLIGGINGIDNGINNLIQGIETNVDISNLENQKSSLQAQITQYTTKLSTIPSASELEASVVAGLLTAEQAENLAQTRALLEGLVASLQANYNSLLATESLYGGLNQLKNGIEKEDGLLAGANAIKVGIESTNPDNPGLLAGANALKTGIESEDGLLAGANAIKNGIEKEDGLLAGANALKMGTTGLTSGVNALSDGTSKLKAGSSKVANGLGQLAYGSNTLKNGVNTLSDGATALYDGTVKLTDGSKQLVDGSKTLADGLKQFNEEGINKISELVDTGKDLIRKIEKLEKLSNDYTNFASREKRDDLKFIAITDSIKAETETKNSKKR